MTDKMVLERITALEDAVVRLKNLAASQRDVITLAEQLVPQCKLCAEDWRAMERGSCKHADCPCGQN